jgi:VWFA-related protein
MKPVDRAAIYTTSGQNTLDFTDDREKLAESMNRIVPRSRRLSETRPCPYASEYNADRIVNWNDSVALDAVAGDARACGAVGINLPPATAKQLSLQLAQATATRVDTIAESDRQVTLALLTAVVQRMSAMPGQRNVVVVSQGFLVTPKFRQEEMRLIDHAIRANVSIGAINSRGVWARPLGEDSERAEEEVLGELAEATGGMFFHNNNDLKEGLNEPPRRRSFYMCSGFRRRI